MDDKLALEQGTEGQAPEESHGYAQYNPSMVAEVERKAEPLRRRRRQCMSSNSDTDVGVVVVEDHRVEEEEEEDESFFSSSFKTTI